MKVCKNKMLYTIYKTDLTKQMKIDDSFVRNGFKTIIVRDESRARDEKVNKKWGLGSLSLN